MATLGQYIGAIRVLRIGIINFYAKYIFS